MHFCQLAIQLLNPSDQVENDRSARKIDAQVTPQPLHATKLDHRTSRQQRFICWTLECLDQASLHQPRNERAPSADRLGNDIEGQWFIKIKIACPHNSSNKTLSPCQLTPWLESRYTLQLFVQTTLFVRDIFRYRDLQAHIFIASPALPLVQTLATQTQALPALCAGWNCQFNFSINRRGVYLCTENCFPWRNR